MLKTLFKKNKFTLYPPPSFSKTHKKCSNLLLKPQECLAGNYIKNHFFTSYMCLGDISPVIALCLCGRTKLPAKEVNNRFISVKHSRVCFCS